MWRLVTAFLAIALALLLYVFVVQPIWAESPKRVLVLHGQDRLQMHAVERAIRTTLRHSSPYPIDYYIEQFDVRRFPEPHTWQDEREYLRRKYTNRKLDLLIAISDPALTLLLQPDDALFPDVPIVFSVVNKHGVEPMALAPRATGVFAAYDYKGTLEMALGLLPETRRVAFIGGTTPAECTWERKAQEHLRVYANRLEFLSLADLSEPALFDALAHLPERTIVIYVSRQRGATGAPVLLSDVQLARMAEISRAPVFSVHAGYLGHGIVGGALVDFEAQGAQAAELGGRVLRGEKPQDIPWRDGANVSVFDWRQLQRWGISESRLPPGSIVQYKGLSLWAQYREYTITGGFLGSVGAVLVTVLLARRKRRRQVEQTLDERLRAERALRDSEAKFRALFESNVMPLNYWHADGRVLDANDAYLRLTGFSREELQAGHLRWDTLTAPEERALHHRALAELAAGQESCTPYEKEYHLRDGRRVPVLISGALLPGYTDRGVGGGLNLSERKQADAALQKAQGDLAHVTRVLTMGELAASLAHEIHQPLTAILSNAQAAQRFLASDAPDLAEVRAVLADIIEDDKRANEVIYRLRSLLRKSQFELLSVSLNQVIEEVRRLLHSEAIMRNVAIGLELAPDLPPVHGDPVQLQQVILNLMLNGFEAMAAPAIDARRLVVRTQRVRAHTVEVAVHDCGVGLNEDELERIFEPFYTTKPTGMGMGLSICRSILDAHGGRLWAVNNPDQGATFYFTLPVSAEVLHEPINDRPADND